MNREKELRWDKTAADGHQGELFAIWAADGMRSGASLEVKADAASWATGNVYIEYQCFKSGQWVASGIDHRHTQAELWAHIIAGPIVIFAPTEFVRYVARKYGKPKELPATRTTHPTRGVVIPIPQFVAALTATGKTWASSDHPLPGSEDKDAPFGRNQDGVPLAPWGHRKDGKVRRQAGGRRPASDPAAKEFSLLSTWDNGTADPGATS